MSQPPRPIPADFPILLKEIKTRIQQARTQAILAANAELVRLYWDIGRMIDGRQRQEGWGAGVIPRLARELRNDLPEVKGFSERNLDRMIAFYRAYPSPSDFSPPPVAKLPASEKAPQAVAKSAAAEQVSQPAVPLPDSILWSVPWAHHVVLMEKVKDLKSRLWYMQQTLANGWSRNILLTMVQSEAHRRLGTALTNFERLLPPPQSDLARQTLKDPYIFDFLTLEEPFHERELEANLLRHLERFLLELGQGFAFVGRQLHLQVGDSDFYIDLLFYHLKLRCFVVIDLKAGAFKPEYAGKMNFYLSVVDDQLRHDSDAPSIGLILCQDRNHIIAEYALRGVNKPIGISEYELTRALPPRLQSALPTVEEIEAELAASDGRRITGKADAKVAKDRKLHSAKRPKLATKTQPKKGRCT
ncbi:MAG: PDDEXK nuclease domain-containing protein [Nitrospira sp.]|nr:PDDEXK nuclease domain-containing protein [Nitrospira sp.]